MKTKTTKYVVLGAAGKTGGAVMDELLRAGTAPAEIRAVVRRRDARCSELVRRGVDVVEADLFDPMEIRESLSGTQRANFFRTPLSPGWNFQQMERVGGYPESKSHLYAADNQKWRTNCSPSAITL